MINFDSDDPKDFVSVTIFVLNLEDLMKTIDRNYRYYYNRMRPFRDIVSFPIVQECGVEPFDPNVPIADNDITMKSIHLKFNDILTPAEDWEVEIVAETYRQIKAIREELEENEVLFVDDKSVTNVFVRSIEDGRKRVLAVM